MPIGKYLQRSILVVFALLTGTYSATTNAGGKLDRVGQQVRRDAPSPSPAPPSRSSTESHCSSPSHNRELDHAVGQLFAYVIFSPWLIPNFALEEGRARGAPYHVRFADYPYADDAPSFLFDAPPPSTIASIDDGVLLHEATPPSSQRVAAQLAIETGFASGVMRNGLDARVQFPMRLELDTDWSLYREADHDEVDTTWLGREHLTLRFAESTAVQFRSGIGPQHLRDALGWVHGFDVTWGLDAFPGRPVVLAFEGSAGLLGKAFAAGLSARIGLMQGPFEVSAGWHQRWIGDVPLGAPFMSIRFWL